jgi:hypothetical protein
MAYRSPDDDFCAEIEAAREAVCTAQKAYERGGSVDAVNRANDRLTDAHYRWREWSGGRVPDNR